MWAVHIHRVQCLLVPLMKSCLYTYESNSTTVCFGTELQYARTHFLDPWSVTIWFDECNNIIHLNLMEGLAPNRGPWTVSCGMMQIFHYCILWNCITICKDSVPWHIHILYNKSTTFDVFSVITSSPQFDLLLEGYSTKQVSEHSPSVVCNVDPLRQVQGMGILAESL